MFFGNALLYVGLYQLVRAGKVVSNTIGISFIYWLALMCAGNVWGCVPIRAITTHADIAIAARGLHWSVWVLLPFLLVPSLYLVYHFFYRMLPRCIVTMTRGSLGKLAPTIALTGYWFFAFFGGEGTDGSYRVVTQLLTLASKYILFPLSILYLATKLTHAYDRPARQSAFSGQLDTGN